MGIAGEDVIHALEDARTKREELADLRHALETVRHSRLGRVVVAWSDIRATLFGGFIAGRASPFRRHVVAAPTPAGTRTAPSASTEGLAPSPLTVERLRGDLLELGRNLEQSRALQRALVLERDVQRAKASALAGEVARAQREIELVREARLADARHLRAARTDAARLSASVERERAAIVSLVAERDADRATATELRWALEDAKAEGERRLSEAIEASANDVVRAARPPQEETVRDGERHPTLDMKRSRLVRALRAAPAVFDVAEADVTVVVPAFNQAEMTLNCLVSVAQAIAGSPTIQLIVVDDASPENDLTASLAGVPFVTVVRNGGNLGFLRSCNRAARLATGRYIHFLNNDTLVREGWLREMVAVADADPRVGAVGSRLLFEDGSLQEGGGIIWRDASGWNYGRGDDPEDPRYNYVRDVDFCSGASLLVRASVFRDLGGFDDAYAPAYFEDSDLCFAIRKRGMRVVYQPKSVVVHLEGKSSGTSTESGIKRHQVLNKPTFVEKWRGELERHYVPDSVPGIRAARRLERPKTLVMIDNYVPEYDKDSGSNKLFNFIKLYQQLDYNVIFVPDNYNRSEPYTTTLQNLGVEVLYRSDSRPVLEEALRERLEDADVVWIGRPELGEKYLPVVRAYPRIPMLYDTHDLHYVRERRELELKGVTDKKAWAQWEQQRDRELRVVGSADVAMTVTDVEQRVLQEAGMDNVFVMPNVHDSFERNTPYGDTAGIIFIGGYVHGPNVDAVVWLCKEIMPIVWRTHPDMIVTLIGSNAPKAVTDLASSRVHVPGYVSDVTAYFESARLMVAPLRYGAGLKGKIGHAFAYGLPTVTTPIGAEGFHLVEGSDALVAEDTEGLAREIVRAYDDRDLWQTLSDNGARIVRRFSPDETRKRLAEATALAFERRARTLAATRA